MKRLADFEGYDPAAREAALAHFGEKSIELILGSFAQDEVLRDELARMLWSYARGAAGKDGSGRELPSEVRRSITSLDKAAHLLDEALNSDAASFILFTYGVDRVNARLMLERILSATENFESGKGGRPADIEHGLLMYRTARLFTRVTGQQATITTNRIDGGFSGEFFKTAELVDTAASSTSQSRPKTNKALGKLLERILAPPKP
jgi:hypothetical protein